MAAGSNSVGASTYTAIAFGILSVALGITTYMFSNEAATHRATAVKAETDRRLSDAAFKAADNDVRALKELIGIKLETVANPGNPDDGQTVVGSGKSEIAKLAGPMVQQNFLETMRRVRQEYDQIASERDSLRTNLDAEHKQFLDLQGQYNSRAENFQTAKTKAETDLRAAVSNFDENVRKKDQLIGKLRNDFNQIQVELDQLRESSEKLVKQREEEIKNLNIRIVALNEELETIRRVSFEIPDGKIVKIDNSLRMVWVDLGEADFLKIRTTFSVYSKNNSGVGRGAEDIKAQVEVTRILGPHLAEARITEEDSFRPIAPDDVVYSPLWSPGRSEKFAFIGFLDIDGDERSDRELIRTVLANANAKIHTEVNDDGNRTGGTIDEGVKFLVRGRIPELGETVSDEEREKFRKIADELDKLKKEALEHGVRTISLSDFIAYIGYKPKRRLFQPGDGKPFTLQGGREGTRFSDKSSIGNVSPLFQSKKPGGSGAGDVSSNKFRSAK